MAAAPPQPSSDGQPASCLTVADLKGAALERDEERRLSAGEPSTAAEAGTVRGAVSGSAFTTAWGNGASITPVLQRMGWAAQTAEDEPSKIGDRVLQLRYMPDGQTVLFLSYAAAPILLACNTLRKKQISISASSHDNKVSKGLNLTHADPG